MKSKPSRAVELEPDFSDEDFHKALRQYQKPLRRSTAPQKRCKVKEVQKEENQEERFWLGGDSGEFGGAADMGLDDGGGVEESEAIVTVGMDDRTTLNSSPVRQPSMSQITEAQLSLYADAVESYAAGFYYIEDSLFAVEGWNVGKEESNGHWYHLQQISEEGVIAAVCTCPAALQSFDCVHRAYIVEFVKEPLEGDSLEATVYKDYRVAVFARQQVPNSEEFETKVSVGSPFHHGLKGRAIITHLGSHPSAGMWTCSKSHSGAGNCAHIPAARRVLLGLLGMESNAEGSGNEAERNASVEGSQALQLPPQAIATISRHGSVSYLPVLPPVSVMLKSDISLYTRPKPFRNPPTRPLPLTEGSSCACPGATRSVFKASEDIEVGACRIYTMLGLHNAEIQTQRCPSCTGKKRRCIGPDLRQMGLFNYNNRVVVSHELLDEYTISFASSETPFTAFVALMDHRYMAANVKFMGEDLFRDVWFSYVSIQAFEDDMRCSLCGPVPDTVIWDGVTVAFHKKHISRTIRPPTSITPHSLPRPLVKPVRNQQLIIDPSLRKDIRLVIKSFRKNKDIYFDDGDGDDDDAEDEAPDNQTQVEIDVARIDSVSERLSELCPSLSMLFLSKYGYIAYLNKKRPLVAYRSFFLQIAAEESVLQMINAKSLGKLRDFISNPVPSNFFSVACIPGLFQVLKHHGSTLSLLPICKWLEVRAGAVLDAIIVDKLPIPVFPKGHVVADWRLTGCFYSLPHIRDRPVYRGIRHDRTKEDSRRGGDTCGKFYDEYGKDGMSGGIMAGWCTHSVCYGFHCIPASEGRDDVFSAMVTRWPVAPKHVIYDFACALGPYCMLREPEFFKNTLFAIDDFHAQGHTKCSPAAFLLEYASADPRLVSINSSAGECGNSALRRIRKSISYMSQERAVIYTKVFLSIWNRTRIIKKRL